MKTLQYTVDIERLKLSDAEKEFFAKDGQKSIFENILNQALGQQNPNGLDGKTGRILSRILCKLDQAIGAFIQLEEAEFDLIKSTIGNEETKFQPAQYRLINLYCESIEAAEKQKEK